MSPKRGREREKLIKKEQNFSWSDAHVEIIAKPMVERQAWFAEFYQLWTERAISEGVASHSRMFHGADAEVKISWKKNVVWIV